MSGAFIRNLQYLKFVVVFTVASYITLPLQMLKLLLLTPEDTSAMIEFLILPVVSFNPFMH